ncbi:DMT family transporter [Marinicellulosiphila megalodicopiae]|uniref:DMT family transporter n=1 Tax=Marinicellulosiphila megalodicopiae TaxID=2724896 RepID=UPI003BB1BA3F
MQLIYFIGLIILAAIWGASFLFMRVASPEFGPFALNLIRITGAALILLPLCLKPDFRQTLKKYWSHFMLLGATNYAIPFTLFSYTSLTLNSGFTSLINATTPILTAVIGVSFFQNKIQVKQIIGLLLAFLGIYIVSIQSLSLYLNGTLLAIFAGLIATSGYGYSLLHAKKYLHELKALEMTAGGLFFGGLYLIIPGVIYWPQQIPSTQSWLSAFALTILCTVIAFLIFFQIIKKLGALASSTVTFLVPIFAISWGVLLLNETLSLQIILGIIVILTGTALVVFSTKKQ